MPFGGLYRLIDFALSNLVNAGIRRICVLTQYKSHSLDRHVTTTWRLSSLLGNYVTPVPAQQRLGPHWYTGSADAIYQSLNLIFDDQPDIVAVFGADHVYRMDMMQMVHQHMAARRRRHRGRHPGAAGRSDQLRCHPDRQPTAGPSRRSWRSRPIRPGCPATRPVRTRRWATTCSSTDVLIEALRKDAADDGSRHDMGGDILPMLVEQGCAQAYNFLDNEVPGAEPRDVGYWRDVGTLDSYFDAHLDLCAVHPIFNLYNDRWPILTHVPSQPPAKFVHDSGDRVGPRDQQRGQQRRDRLRRPGQPVRAVAWSAGQHLVPGGALGHHAQHHDRQERRRQERDPRQERRGARRTPSSAWTRTTTGLAASSCRRAASRSSARARRSP